MEKEKSRPRQKEVFGLPAEPYLDENVDYVIEIKIVWCDAVVR